MPFRLNVRAGHLRRLGVFAFLALFLTVFYFSTTDRRKQQLGTFKDVDRSAIEIALGEVCQALERMSQSHCGPVSWEGKHKWFGRVRLNAKLPAPSVAEFSSVLSSSGWTYLGSSSDVIEFRSHRLNLSLYAPNDKVREFTVTVSVAN